MELSTNSGFWNLEALCHGGRVAKGRCHVADKWKQAYGEHISQKTASFFSRQAFLCVPAETTQKYPILV